MDNELISRLFLEATQTNDKNVAINNLKQILELNPNHTETRLLLLRIESKDYLNDLIKMREKEYESIKDRIDFLKDDLFKNELGQPYLKMTHEIIMGYLRTDSLDKALEEGLEMLKLNQDDNLGVRYTLAHICINQNKTDIFDKCLSNYFLNDNTVSGQFINLFIDVLKKETNECIEKAKIFIKNNPYFNALFIGFIPLDDNIKDIINTTTSYMIGSLEEAVVSFDEMNQVITNKEIIRKFTDVYNTKEITEFINEFFEIKPHQMIILIAISKHMANYSQDEIIELLLSNNEELKEFKEYITGVTKESLDEDMSSLYDRHFIENDNGKLVITYLAYSFLQMVSKQQKS